MTGGAPASGTGTTGGFKLGSAPSTGTSGFTFGASATPGTTTSTATPGFGGFGQPQTGNGIFDGQRFSLLFTLTFMLKNIFSLTLFT